MFGGLLEPTCNFLPPDIPGYEKLDPCPYGPPGKSTDIARAKRLVRRAGAAGADVKVWGPQQDPGPQVMSYLADVLDEIGLDPKLNLVDFAVYSQTVGNLGTHPQIGFMSWAGDFPHPFAFLRQFDSGTITETGNFNVGEVRDPVIDAGLEAAQPRAGRPRSEGQLGGARPPRDRPGLRGRLWQSDAHDIPVGPHGLRELLASSTLSSATTTRASA